MPEATGVFDEGMQLERTVLAWQRTALVAVVGACVLARVLLESWGLAGMVPSTLAACTAAAAATMGWRRYRTADRALRRTGQPESGAAPGLLLATCVVSLGLLVMCVAGRSVLDATMG